MKDNLLNLKSKLLKVKKELKNYIDSNDFSEVDFTFEEFMQVIDLFPVAPWIDSDFTDWIEKVLQKDIWDLSYSKYETVYFTDFCNRIADLSYDEDIKSLIKWFNVSTEEEAINSAIDFVKNYALKTKTSGFKLDW